VTADAHVLQVATASPVEQFKDLLQSDKARIAGMTSPHLPRPNAPFTRGGGGVSDTSSCWLLMYGNTGSVLDIPNLERLRTGRAGLR
jgi:hypothetical protein